jgi:hypothetical protein
MSESVARMFRSRGKRYRVTYTGTNSLRYEDDEGSLDLGFEYSAVPGIDVDIVRVPSDFHLSRDELMERIWRAKSRWRFTVRFFDERNREIFPPSRRESAVDRPD